jgi:hypothetical protein
MPLNWIFVGFAVSDVFQHWLNKRIPGIKCIKRSDVGSFIKDTKLGANKSQADEV